MARRHETMFAAFVRRIERDDDTGCWNWTGRVEATGYCITSNDGRKMAHRLAHELFTGPIPQSHVVDHRCRNRRCVNPDHLDAVTPAENVRRQRIWAALETEYCPAGHPWNVANTYMHKGHRLCRPCRLLNQRAYLARRAAT